MRQLLERYNMSFEPVANDHVRSQLPPRTLYCRATRDFCDCGTLLGSGRNDPSISENAREQRHIERLRKKGWSEAKISRWQSQKSLSAVNQDRSDQNETSRWTNFLLEVLTNQYANRIGLIIHDYSGSLKSEKFSVKRLDKISAHALTQDFFKQMEADVLYEISYYSAGRSYK